MLVLPLSLASSVVATPVVLGLLPAASAVVFLVARRGWLSPVGWGSVSGPRLPPGNETATGLALFLIAAGTVLGVTAVELPRLREAGELVSVVGLLAAAACFLQRVGDDPEARRIAGVMSRRPRRDVVTGLGGFFVGAVLTWTVLSVGAWIVGTPRTMAAGAAAPGLGVMIVAVVMSVVIAPLLEETVYRGLLQTWLLSWLGADRRWAAVGLAAAAFSLVHAPGASGVGLAGLFVLGLVLGVLYERTGSLLPCVVAHAGYNAATIAAGLLMT